MSDIKVNLKKLVEEAIIDKNTAEKIKKWQEVEQGKHRKNYLLSVFTTLGAIAIWLGIFLLIAANWSEMTQLFKVFLLFCITFLFYFSWYYITYKKDSFQKTGTSLIFIWALSYGATIFLLGQIYNVGGSFFAAFFFWFLGILPFAYFTWLRTIFALTLVLVYAFTFSYFWENYYFSGFQVALIFISIAYIYLIGIAYHEKTKKWKFAPILGGFWVLTLLGALFPFTFNDFWRFEAFLWRDTWEIGVFLLVVVLFWILLLSLRVIKNKKFDLLSDLPFFVGIIPFLFLIFYAHFHALLRADYTRYQNGTPFILELPEGIYVLLMNLLYLWILWFFVYLGIKKERPSFINLSLLFFAVYLIGKYFSFLENSKVDGAIVFITGGVVCLFVGWFTESLRRKILAKY